MRRHKQAQCSRLQGAISSLRQACSEPFDGKRSGLRTGFVEGPSANVGRKAAWAKAMAPLLDSRPDQEPIPHHREAEGQRGLVEHQHINVGGLEEEHRSS
jgi:hypothetical protein